MIPHVGIAACTRVGCVSLRGTSRRCHCGLISVIQLGKRRFSSIHILHSVPLNARRINRLTFFLTGRLLCCHNVYCCRNRLRMRPIIRTEQKHLCRIKTRPFPCNGFRVIRTSVGAGSIQILRIVRRIIRRIVRRIPHTVGTICHTADIPTFPLIGQRKIDDRRTIRKFYRRFRNSGRAVDLDLMNRQIHKIP